jgi:two-component system cell cycle response regulator DivK
MPSGKVLIVEDSEDNREVLRHIIHYIGYEVLEAVNGQQAVEITKEKHPDLILMDLSMPVLDGYGAARQIRELHPSTKVPIIAVSAHETSDNRAKALAIGFDEYLTKPIDFTQLKNVIFQFLTPA